MARVDKAQVDRAYERPSRGSRVLVWLCTLLVLMLAGFVLTPIVFPNLSATLADLPLVREVTAATTLSSPTPPDETRRAAVTRLAHDLAMQPPASALPTEAAPDPAPSVEPTADTAADSEPPSSALALATPSLASAGLVPWPLAPAAAPAADDVEAGEAPENFGPVPLPRRRPGATAMAGIPLPRPRPTAAPEVTEEVADPYESLFQRQSRPD